MLRGRSSRIGAAIMAAGVFLVSAAGSLAAIGGKYTGSGKGFGISFVVRSGYVDQLSVSCRRGAITVVPTAAAAPKVNHGSFSYSGPAASSNSTKSIKMKVTGTFFDKGRKVKGPASTSGVCKSGQYTASK